MKQAVGNKNVIELNGKHYDALTGNLLKANKTTGTAGRSIDSIVDRLQLQSIKVPDHKPTPKADLSSDYQDRELKSVSKLKLSESRKLLHKHVINPKNAHKPEHSKTLMRHSVKQPSKTSRVSHSLEAKSVASLPAATKAAISERRIALSRQVNRSHLINRFRSSSNNHFTKRTPSLAVHKPPAKSETANEHKPVAAEKAAIVAAKKPDIFTIALDKATSHEQKPLTEKIVKHKTNSKVGNALLLTAVVVLISGILAGGTFAIIKNLAHIELRWADWRSGVSASLPTYVPSSYKVITPIEYSRGSVTINFKKTGSQQFNLTEQSSDWDSQTLQDSFVATTSPKFQTLLAGGNTIYVYGNGNATWVTGGIWYQIGGSSGLSNTDLLNIATSL